MVLDTLRRMFNKPSSEELNKPSSEELIDFIDSAQSAEVYGIKKFLDKYPAEVDITGSTRETALIFTVKFHVSLYALCGRYPDTSRIEDKSEDFRNAVKLLLEKGADINAQNYVGMTVLDYIDDAMHESDIADVVLRGDRDFLKAKGAKTGAEVGSTLNKLKSKLVGAIPKK